MNPPPDIIVILEDNLDRLEIMRGIVVALPGDFEIRHFDGVDGLRALSSEDLTRVRLISLDFNLENSSASAPGDGMAAVEFLIHRNLTFPVIVHTSSLGDSDRMADALTGRGWTVRQVNFGKRDRVEKWRASVTELLAGKA